MVVNEMRVNMTHGEVEVRVHHGVVYIKLLGNARNCFTPSTLADLREMLELVTSMLDGGDTLTHFVWVFSENFNGGDLKLFAQLAELNDFETLCAYGKNCVQQQLVLFNGFAGRLITVAVVDATLMGGAAEAALACQYVLVTKSAKMRVPESMFGFFPGMGWHVFLLQRRVSLPVVEWAICERPLLDAQMLYHLGIADMVIEDLSESESAVRAICAVKTYGGTLALPDGRDVRFPTALNSSTSTALSLVRQTLACALSTESALLAVVRIWADTAARLDAKYVRRMCAVVHAQRRQRAASTNEEVVA